LPIVLCAASVDRTASDRLSVGNTEVTIVSFEIHEFLTSSGVSPFRAWFDRLDARAAAKVTVALLRLEQGNLSSVNRLLKKSVHGLFQRGCTKSVVFACLRNQRLEKSPIPPSRPWLGLTGC